MKRSNCLIEAIKAKLKNWKNVKIGVIPTKINGHFHIYWIDYTNSEKPRICHYINPKKNWNIFFYRGIYKEYTSLRMFQSILIQKCVDNSVNIDYCKKYIASQKLNVSDEFIENAYVAFKMTEEELEAASKR